MRHKLQLSKFKRNALIVAILLLNGVFALQAQDYKRIKSKKDGTYINNQEGKAQSSRISTGWWSAQWIIENVEGTGYFRFKNRWKPNEYLHIEHGKLACGPIEKGWWSAQWQFLKIPLTNFKHIRNRWKPNENLQNENGYLTCSEIKGTWEGAQWEISPASETVVNPITNKSEEEQKQEKPVAASGYYIGVTATIKNDSDWQVSYRINYDDGSKSNWYYASAHSTNNTETEPKPIAFLEFQWKDITTWKKLGFTTKQIANYQQRGTVNTRVAAAQNSMSVTIKGSILPPSKIRLVE